MAGLTEYQKRMAEDRARILEKRIEQAEGISHEPSQRAPSTASGGMSQADFGGGPRKQTDKQKAQLAALLRKRAMEN